MTFETTPATSFWGKLLFGDVTFQESDEYQEFQFKFLVVLMVLAAFFTLLFVVGAYMGANPMGMPHLGSMTVFTLLALFRQSIEQLMPDIGSRRLPMTASIGVADNSSGLQTMMDIQQCADAAMYDAKAGGRNRVSCFEKLAP